MDMNTIALIKGLAGNGGGGSSLPTNPAQDGTYALQNTVSSGTSTLSWASGGSSGGGALVVNVTGAYGVCDKTAGEMFAAFSKGPIIINYDGEGVYEIVYSCIIEGTSYTFNTMENQFKASSAEGYPSIY